MSRLPSRVTIELTNRCNRACDGCPRHKTIYPIGNMNWQLYTEILAQLRSNTIIVPFFRGESLLHPQFADAMKELERFSTVQLATNGDFLSSNQAAIINACSFVSLSLHNFKTYLNYEQETFFQAAKKEGVATQVSILENLVPPNKKQKFIDIWLKHVDRVRIYVEHSLSGYGDMVLPIHENGQPCFKPFTDMVVYWDGKVALCCQDWNNQLGLGDLNSQSIGDVWNSQVYEDIRVKQQRGKRREIQSCRDCHQWIADYNPDNIVGELYFASHMASSTERICPVG